jgi:hypothetical protein
MWRRRMFVGVAALAAGTSWLAVAPAGAANSPTFRDCSFAGGTDPDFVRLSEVTVAPNGTLTVPAGQTQVTLEASESSNPGDNVGHVKLKAKVSSRHVRTQKRSGAGTGKVTLALPLNASSVGRSYTISWMDTTDNGHHHCPSAGTPENTSPKPFVVTVQ